MYEKPIFVVTLFIQLLEEYSESHAREPPCTSAVKGDECQRVIQNVQVKSTKTVFDTVQAQIQKLRCQEVELHGLLF